MGRNKIAIDYIEKKKERSVTFCKRKVGLLKKASELSTLCGVDVSLIFTDMTGNVHFFTNNEDFKFAINSTHQTKVDEQNLYTYNPSNYPFTGEGDNVKKIKASRQERDEILMKREDNETGIFFKYENEVTKASKHGINYEPKDSDLYVRPKSSLYRWEEYKIDNSSCFNNTPGLLVISDPRIQTFFENIESLITTTKSSNNCDDELLLLLILRCLTEKCLKGSKYCENGQIVDKESLLTFLDTIKFKEKPKDMILAYINQVNDIL